HLTGCDNQIVRLNDQIGRHASRVGQINGELGQIKRQGEELRLRLEEFTGKRDEGEQTRRHHEERFSELQRQYAELEGTVRERTRRIEELSAKANALRDTVARAENESRMAEALIEKQQEERANAEQILGTLNEECLNHQVKHEELKAQADTEAAQLAAAQETLASERNTQRERQEQLGQKLRDIQQIAGKLNQGHSRLDTLKELKASYEGYYQGVREVMVSAESGRLRGVLGVAANLIRASSEHEVAIEVALATHLQDIVTRTADDARDAINYLKDSGRGRATFLPLDRLQSQPLPQHLCQVLGRPGVIGIASEIVQYDKQIEIAVQFLLGSTIVVKDLDVGLELGRQGFRARYVSLDGQLINPAGSMTGGRIQATGLMTREREIRDLAVTIEQLEREHAATQSAVEKLQLELNTAHHKIEALASEVDQRRISQATLLKDVEAAQRAADQAQKALDVKTAQIARIDEDIAAKRETIARAAERYAEAFAGLSSAEAELTAEREIAREQGAGIIDLGMDVAEARAQMEKARERIQDAVAQLQSIERDLDAVTRTEEARRKEIESLAEQDVLLNQQIERIKSETSALREQTETMAQKISQDQIARDELQNRMKQLAQEVEVLNRDTTQFDNKYREVELQAAELNANMTAIAEQCRDKYQRDLDDLAAEIGPSERDAHALQVEVAEMRDKLDRMGIVNMAALDEYQEQAKRLDFLKTQQADLAEAKKQLEDTIARLDETTRKLFHETFEKVRENFIGMFRRLFNGGKADLILEAPDGQDPLLEGGIEIMAQPPGKKLQSITLMSGGEKAMTAVSLLFALFMYRPSPFCIMDEIDAPLDDANIERFKGMVREFIKTTQFMIITHNKITMELADAIYGVTMEESGVSKLVSVRFEQAADLVDAV
ncbi:chromosome segregation protein SMC, partial [bacterium]|nr:chromosome segregation protein SMC [bacterium]